MQRVITRRDALRAGGTVGVLGVAGCVEQAGPADSESGGQTTATTTWDGGDATVRMTWAGEASGIYTAGLAFAKIINENHDSITIEARPSGGSKQSMSKLANGDSDFGFIDLHTANKIKNGTGEYSNNPFDTQLTQAWTLWVAQGTWGTVPGTGIETVEDLEGKRISVGASGGTWSDFMIANLKKVGLTPGEDYEAVNMPFADEPSALKAGRIDAATWNILNRTLMAPNLQKQQQLNPQQTFVEWPESTVEKINQDRALNGQYYSPSDFDAKEVVGWNGREELWFTKSTGMSFVRPGLDKRIAYEILKTADENSEQLKEAHPMLRFWVGDGSFSFMADHVADWLPVHPGVKQFYKEKGIL